MTKLTIICIAVVLAALPGDQPTKDERLILGAWELDSCISGGTKVETDLNKIFIDRISWRAKNSVFRYSLDESKSPKEVDWHLDGDVWRGIYKVTEDELTLCVGQSSSDRRPTSFSSTKTNGYSLHVRKRVEVNDGE